MLGPKEIEARLQDRNLTKVAEASGVPYQTVWRVKEGNHERVAYDTVKRLSDYLEANQ